MGVIQEATAKLAWAVARTTKKPHLTHSRYMPGVWICTTGQHIGYGDSKEFAYEQWRRDRARS